MKTRSYYGQDLRQPFGPGDQDHVGNVVEFEEWLLRPKEFLSGEVPMLPKASLLPHNPTSQPINRCICRNVGLNGQRDCSMLPHKHILSTTGFPRLVACDNHLKCYLDLGFKRSDEEPSAPTKAPTKAPAKVPALEKACARCVTNEAMPNDTLCEVCDRELTAQAPSDAIRLKQVGYCLNRNVVHGCLIYSEPANNLCKFCLNYMKLANGGAGGVQAKTPNKAPTTPGPRVRTIPTSARPCDIAPNCPGNMQASVRRYDNISRPELWWTCPLCRGERLAERTKAVLAKENLSPQMLDALSAFTNEGGASEVPDGVVDLRAAMVRDMLDQDDG